MSFSWKNPMILATLQPSVTVAKGKISVATMTHGWGCGCGVVIHASPTKFTSPAKLFLNDNIFNFLNFFLAFRIFVVMMPAERSVK